jgi:hypothetical protein
MHGMAIGTGAGYFGVCYERTKNENEKSTDKDKYL